MKVELPRKWSDKLTALPENGMGNQVVDVFLNNGDEHRGLVVLNCSSLVLKDDVELDPSMIRSITLTKS